MDRHFTHRGWLASTVSRQAKLPAVRRWRRLRTPPNLSGYIIVFAKYLAGVIFCGYHAGPEGHEGDVIHGKASNYAVFGRGSIETHTYTE